MDEQRQHHDNAWEPKEMDFQSCGDRHPHKLTESIDQIFRFNVYRGALDDDLSSRPRLVAALVVHAGHVLGVRSPRRPRLIGCRF